MVGTRQLAVILFAAALPLAACSGKDKEATKADAAPVEGGVVRNETAPVQPAVQRAPEQVAIQSQPGPDGSQVDLLKVAVTGDILTVTMRCSSDKSYNTETFKIGNISVVEDATSQRLSVLRDNAGTAMVSNFDRGSSPEYDSMRAECGSRPGVIWAKFPAPAATSPTVSINFPGVAPFDGIAVAR